ncbi:MAG: type II toxin-antitoxin system HicA family toxin [Candidatus Hydrogenedentes bacterium]|nr:type II toxin-antitoxin system HicA family toxin [Candidatus Hydrogenedentota bacterium]
MTRRHKLLDQLRNSPGNIRFSQVEALLKHEGFVLFNQRGSHRAYHRADGRVLTIVKPHGGRKTCHPSDIRKLLEALRHDNNA